MIVLLSRKECWQTLEALFGTLAREVCRGPENIRNLYSTTKSQQEVYKRLNKGNSILTKYFSWLKISQNETIDLPLYNNCLFFASFLLPFLYLLRNKKSLLPFGTPHLWCPLSFSIIWMVHLSFQHSNTIQSKHIQTRLSKLCGF